ncbi:MAG: alginate export family protein, partial [Zavarzinella sp.]|nr:alginate export family protein [Zavarzinella sp.]
LPAAGGTACPNPWASVPVIQPLPRVGFFLVPPTGPGYYSFEDLLHGNCREKPPAYPFPPLALQASSNFDADYRYLDKPDNTQTDPFDVVKRMHPTPDTMVTIGGQHSARFMNEVDPRLGRVDNQYMLYRNRVWADFWYEDKVRLYGEFISALIAGNELPPLPIDENRADILNLFAEVKVGEVAGQPVYVRVGRQELLLGSQRLVSPLDWANTRRTFEGVRAFRRSEDLDVDVFWTRPVIIKPGDPDSANHDIQFYGAWVTYRPVKGQLVDVYYLGLTDDTVIRDRFLPAARAPRGTQEVHTFGARYAGNEGSFLFDLEGMVQTGTYVQRDHWACAGTAAVGWEFEEHPWRPQVWAGYDYASGTPNPAAGDDRTFNQLFPFGHYYLGWIDLVGRQNIEDLNFQVAAYPDDWVTVVAQYHHFRLAEARDFLYNAAGLPTRRSPTGRAGRDVGQEIDLAVNFHLTPHQDVLVGYSKLFAGDFIRATGPAVSPELFYAMYNFRW